MADALLDDLYREIILDHYRQPRHRGQLVSPTCSADGANPLCGDQVTVSLRVDGDRIADISFSGNGCSISQASASMMTEYALGRSPAEALAGVEAFAELMRTGEPTGRDGFDDIDALAGVSKFAARVKCASLAWKTLEQALLGRGDAVTTDDGSMA